MFQLEHCKDTGGKDVGKPGDHLWHVLTKKHSPVTMTTYAYGLSHMEHTFKRIDW